MIIIYGQFWGEAQVSSLFSEAITRLESGSARFSIGLEQTENGQIGHLHFTYPQRHNIIDLQGWQSLPNALNTLADSADMRLIILRGTGGRAFVAGADIAQFDEVFSGDSAKQYENATIAAFDALAACPVPTLAAIEGFCLGGGLAIATCCDLRLARDDSVFGVPAAKLGLAYPPNATLRLTELIGRSAANEILFTAQQFDAQKADALGLVNQLARAADFEAMLYKWATEIIANAPLSLQAAKFIMNNPQAKSAQVNKHLAACLQSEDYKEGRHAFAEKRKPIFHGQ